MRQHHRRPAVLRSHPPLGPRHAAMAVAREPQRARGRIPRQGRPAGAAVRRHHAPRHPHGRADPCAGEPADASPAIRSGASSAPASWSRSRRGKWGVITPKDLENAEPKIQKNDIVMINTGSHHNYGDNPDYFAYSPGLYKEAAEWIVERGVKLVGIDVQALDHPLGTFLGPHGPGPGAAASRRRIHAPRPAATSSTTSRTGSRRTRS